MKNNNFFTLLTTLIIILIANMSVAQFYTNLNVGYGLGKSKMNIDGFTNYTSQTFNSYTEEQICLSLGQGFNVGVTGGNMFNDHVGAELGVNYLMGRKFTAEYKYESGTSEYSLQAKMFQIVPAAKISAGFEDINVYGKFGVVIGLGSVKYEIEDTYANNVSFDKWIYCGGVALGFMGALGAEYPLKDNLSIFAELNTINQSYAPKKGELAESTDNGEDRLPGMTTREKEKEFVDELTSTYEGGDEPDSEPLKVLSQKFPLGSVGLDFGIELRF